MSKNKSPLAAKYKFRRALLLFGLFTLLLAGSILGYYTLETTGRLRKAESVTVEIPMGAAVSTISNILQDAGAIGNPYVFRLYLKISNKGTAFQYGTFELHPREGYAALATSLAKLGSHRATVVITIPEGYNAYQIGQVLEKANLCSEDEFIASATNFDTTPFEFLDSISKNDQKMVWLEGFLFPDTYELFANEAPSSVIARMLNNFERRVLTTERKQKITESSFTLEELIIFSAIIQKEAANVEEMHNVSSVFHNRMNNKAQFPRLESCTTNNYINDYIKAKLKNPSAALLNAYDTYSRSGLPVAAIANPGLDAIDAALTPSDTPYYFFVTDIEFTHYYGKTFQDHLANIKKAEALNLTYGKIGL